jgi:hypothetical protein
LFHVFSSIFICSAATPGGHCTVQEYPSPSIAAEQARYLKTAKLSV